MKKTGPLTRIISNINCLVTHLSNNTIKGHRNRHQSSGYMQIMCTLDYRFLTYRVDNGWIGVKLKPEWNQKTQVSRTSV